MLTMSFAPRTWIRPWSCDGQSCILVLKRLRPWQASWDEGVGPPTPPSLPPGGRRVTVKVYDKLVKEFADLTIVQVPLMYSDGVSSEVLHYGWPIRSNGLI